MKKLHEETRAKVTLFCKEHGTHVFSLEVMWLMEDHIDIMKYKHMMIELYLGVVIKLFKILTIGLMRLT
jgi:hypothetical protein